MLSSPGGDDPPVPPDGPRGESLDHRWLMPCATLSLRGLANPAGRNCGRRLVIARTLVPGSFSSRHGRGMKRRHSRRRAMRPGRARARRRVLRAVRARRRAARLGGMARSRPARWVLLAVGLLVLVLLPL